MKAPAAVMQTAHPELRAVPGASHLTATLTATGGFPQAVPGPGWAEGAPDRGLCVFARAGRRPSLGAAVSTVVDLDEVGTPSLWSATGTWVPVQLPAQLPRELKFTIWSVPTPLPRPRVTIRGGKPHAYMPAKATQSQQEIRAAAIGALGAAPRFEGPVRLTVVVYVKPPASLPKRVFGLAAPTKRPDLSNLLKQVEDGLSPLWIDDSQVVAIEASKRFAWVGAPRWEIVVEAI